MKMSLSRIAVASLLLLLCLPAGAVTIVTDTGGTQLATNMNNFGNTWQFTASGITATISAYANTGTGGVFAPARVRQYSGAGLGVCNATEGVSCTMPMHQVDNVGQIDMLLITFNQAVQIQSVGLNMFGTDPNSNNISLHDSDLTYFVGTATRASLETLLPTLTTTSIQNNANNGLLAGALGNNYVGSNTTGTLYRDATLNTGDVNYLLIMPEIGGSSDYFKLLNLVVTPGTTTNEGGVPEPSTYAMLGCGLLALGYFRRFRKN